MQDLNKESEFNLSSTYILRRKFILDLNRCGRPEQFSTS